MSINDNIKCVSEICKDCKEPDWDSYDALGITAEAGKVMVRILKMFHKHGINFLPGVIVPTNSGWIELELGTKVREEYAFVYHDNKRGGYHFTYGNVDLDKVEGVMSLWNKDLDDINREVIRLIKKRGYK